MKRTLVMPLVVLVTWLGVGIGCPTLGQETDATGPKVVGVLSVSSFDALSGHLDRIVEMVNAPPVSLLEEHFAYPDELPQFDPTMPVGHFFLTDGASLLSVTAMSVASSHWTDFDTKVESGTMSAADDRGVFEIRNEEETLYFFRNADLLLISESREALAGVPANPGILLETAAQHHDVSFRLNVRNLSDEAREFVRQSMEQRAQEAIVESQESGGKNSATAKMAQRTAERVSRLLDETNQFFVGVNFDESGAIVADLGYAAIPQTSMAKQMSALAGLSSSLSGFYRPNASAALQSVQEISDADLLSLQTALDAMREGLEAGLQQGMQAPAGQPSPLEDLQAALLEVAKATIDGRHIDAAMSVSHQQDDLTLIAACHAVDAAKLDPQIAGLAQMALQMGPVMGITVEYGDEQYQGFHLHSLSLPPGGLPFLPTASEKPLGLVVGVGQDALCLAAGMSAPAAVRQAIDDSASPRDASASALRFTVEAAGIGALAAFGVQQAASRMELPEGTVPPLDELLDRFQTAAGNGRLAVETKPIPNGAILQLSIDPGVLKVVGVAVELVPSLISAAMPMMGPGGAGDFELQDDPF